MILKNSDGKRSHLSQERMIGQNKLAIGICFCCYKRKEQMIWERVTVLMEDLWNMEISYFWHFKQPKSSCNLYCHRDAAELNSATGMEVTTMLFFLSSRIVNNLASCHCCLGFFWCCLFLLFIFSHQIRFTT